jgi:hypothetical protein
MAQVIGPMREYLIAQGVVRRPDTAASSGVWPGGQLPPLWLEPREGVAAPGDVPPNGSAVQIGADVVLGLYRSGGFSPGPYESTWRRPTVDLRIRARRADFVDQIEKLITSRIIDKYNWQMASFAVIDSGMWRELQLEEITPQAFTFIVSYQFTVYAP